ncbi:ABC transporter ATP-binding protein [Microbacterium sp. NPDC076911]|uniref:sulfate/molybdate ABC transporter ATP-binding protein n=1 Tax=Microbacterium sp. NPDC076911 TaxID=3154958 RepID=UPI003426F057
MTGEALSARVLVQRAGFTLDASLSVAAGEVTALMGPSGAGKSTLLSVLAGLTRLGEGEVTVGDRVLDAAPRPHTHIAPPERRVVLLSQEPRLFPHLSAHTNIAFGLRVRGVPAATANTSADEWLWRVGLAGMGERRPAALSGGQQQRVALARALATSPSVLLLDEPLTSLDTETAGDVRALLHEQLTATRATAIVATHDAVDAVSLATSLIVLEAGKVTQQGPVREVLAEPATRFTAVVAGLNRVQGTVSGGVWNSGPLRIERGNDESARASTAIFRPADVHLEAIEATTWTGALRLSGRIEAREGEWISRVTRLEQTPSGVRVRTEEPEVIVDLSADRIAGLGIAPGLPVRLRIAPADIRFSTPLDSPSDPDSTISPR